MDIRNFTWINAVDLNDNMVTAPPSSSPDSQSSDKTTIILASVLGTLGGVIVLAGGFFAYRWFNKRKRERDAPGFFGSNVDRYEDDVGIPGTPVESRFSGFK
jgi:hypothetical protein